MAWAQKQRSGNYAGLYRLPDGSRRSAGSFSTEAKAKRAASKAEAEAREAGWRDPRNGLMTYGAWVDEWWQARSIETSTRVNEESMIRNHIAPFWDDRKLGTITRFDVQAWATALVNGDPEHGRRPLSPASVRRVLNVFVSSLTAAVDAELIVTNPAVRIDLPPTPKGKEVFLSRQQYAALVDKVERQADRAIMDFLVTTGARWGELAGLHLHNLDLDSMTVRFEDVWDRTHIKPYTKNDGARDVPLMPWGVRELELPSRLVCVQHRGDVKCRSGLVFPGPHGGIRSDRNFSQRVLGPALKDAGLAHLGFTLHDFRHTYASWLVQDGVPLGRVAKLLGHASTRTTEIYAHFAPVTRADIEAALPEPTMLRRVARGTDASQGSAVDLGSYRERRGAR